MNLIKWDPISDLEEMQKALFGDSFIGTRLVSPTSDIYINDDKELVVEAHLPGFSKDEVDVNVHEGVLEIRAERSEREEDKKKKYVLRETSSSFYRRVRLPREADAEKIEAELEDGTLKVTVPYKELPQPNRIAIKEKAKKLKADK